MNDRYATFIVSLLLIVIAICTAIIVTGSGWWILILLFIDLDLKDGKKNKDDED